MAQQPIHDSQLGTVNADTVGGKQVGTGQDQIPLRGVGGVLDADTVGGKQVGNGAGQIPLLDGSGKVSTSILPTTITNPIPVGAFTVSPSTSQAPDSFLGYGTWEKITTTSPGHIGYNKKHTLDNPNAYGTSENDYFGYSVAISDNYAIVGATQEDDASGIDSGKAYIFNPATGALLHTLDNPNAYDTSYGDYFGRSVAISDNYAIVGAYLEDDAGVNSGKAYIFNPATGALLHTLDNPNAYGTSANDYFGLSVAISDNYAIVGAYQEDDAGVNSGKAYIFNPATGALLHILDNPNAYGTSANDYFGRSVAISDNYAIVGAYQEDDAGGTESGKAYIFNPATGALLHTLDNPNAYDTSNGDLFGFSVAVSDNYAVVGAYLEDDAGGTESGKAYIFNPSTGALLHTLDNPNAYGTSANDVFGFSVAVSDNYAVVGAYLEDDAGGGFTSGKAYIFNPATGALLHTLDNPNAYDTSNGDYFGHSVDISDNYAIVGAYQEDDAGGLSGLNSGKAYIYNNVGISLWKRTS